MDANEEILVFYGREIELVQYALGLHMCKETQVSSLKEC